MPDKQTPSKASSPTPASPQELINDEIFLVPEQPPGAKSTDLVQSFNGLAVVLNGGSKAFRELATRLTAKITAFEDWLNKLEVRVPAEHSTAGFRLRLIRSSKRWVIEVGKGPSLMGPPVPTQLLVEADLDTKMKAVKNFPALLDAIVKAQLKRVGELQSVHDEFDSFAESLGIKLEGK